MTNYSHSRLSAFTECRQKYKFRYINLIRTDLTTIEAFLGSRVHDSLEKLYADANRGKVDTMDEIVAYYHRSWEEKWTDSVRITDTNYLREHYQARGENYLREHYSRSQTPSSREMRTVSLEGSNMLELPNGNGYSVRIDRLGCIGPSYFVCDYKTSTSLLTREKAHSDRQLAMYALWVHRTYPDVRNVIQRWHMLHFDKDIDVEHTLDELVKVEQGVIDLISQIEACKEFPPNRSYLCDYCEYHDMCPEFKHLVHIDRLPECDMKRDDGFAMVDEYEKVEQALREGEKRKEQLRQGIIDYSQRFGASAIYGKGLVAKVKETETIRLPEGFAAFLAKNGLMDKYGSVNHARVKAAVLKGFAERIVSEAVTREKVKSLDIRRRCDIGSEESAEENAQ